MKVNCPECGQSFDKDLFPLGDRAACPHCEALIEVLGPKDGIEAPEPQLGEEVSPVAETVVVEDAASETSPMSETSGDREPAASGYAAPPPQPPAPPEPPTPPAPPQAPAPPRFVPSYVRVTSEDADIELRPSDTADVSVRGNADATVREKKGEVVIKADSGATEVEVFLPPGVEVLVKSESGTVRAAELTVDLTVKTESGNVAVANHRGLLTASSESGTLWARNLSGPSVSLAAESGDISLEGWAGVTGEVTLSTESGDIEVRVDPTRASFRYLLKSDSGEVAAYPAGHETFRLLEGRVGEGRADLRAKADSGDIALATITGGIPTHAVPAQVTRKKEESSWGGFFGHMGAFVIVCGALAGLNYATSSYPWVLWVAGPWGMGLLLHFWGATMGALKRNRKQLYGVPPGLKLTKTGPMVRFLHALGPFLAVNGFLFFVDAQTGGGITWAWYPLGAWGVGLSFHLWFAVIRAVQVRGTGNQPTVDELKRKRWVVERNWLGFLTHLGIFVVVNGALAALNFTVGGSYPWFLWPLAAWGIGVFINGWNCAVGTGDYALLAARAPEQAPPSQTEAQGKASLLPVVLLNLSMWAAFALTGFAIPAFGGPAARGEGLLQPVSAAFAGVAGFAGDLPLVYWGVALLASALAFTAFLSTPANRKGLVGFGFYGLSSVFLAATGYVATLITASLALPKA